jgi:hypothetical protein
MPILSRWAISSVKGAAMALKEGSVSLSVTHFTPGSEQMDKYEFGPSRVSMCSDNYRLQSRIEQTVVFPI